MPVRARFGFQWGGGGKLDPDKRRRQEQGSQEPTVDPEAEARERQRIQRLGVAKMVSHLRANEKGFCEVERNSVYGAALALPQVARSGGWPRQLKVLAIRSYLFLVINFLLQGAILYMIAKEEQVFDLFGGQMYLCDTGAFVDTCPDGPNCVGPHRTTITPPRIYDWSSFSVRTYTRDSLKALFPHKAAEIDEQMDPGEYGVESYWCRLVCCFLFMVSVMNDLRCCIDMARLLLYVPSSAEPWIGYEAPAWAEKEHAKSVHGMTELDLVKLKVAGMSYRWKVLNFLVVLCPKVLLWIVTCEAGITFLMETSGMEDTIINSVALTFILNIDEMIFEELMSDDTRIIMDKIDRFNMNDEDDLEHMESEEALQHHETREPKELTLRSGWEVFPLKLVVVLVMTAGFVLTYYWQHCIHNERGGFVSHAMYLPKSTSLDVWTAFFPFASSIAAAAKPFWEYAPPGG